MACHIQFGLLVNMINAQPRIQHINRSPFPGEKVTEHEADLSSPSRTEVTFCGAIPPLHICLQDKHRKNSISIMRPVKNSVCTASNTKTL